MIFNIVIQTHSRAKGVYRIIEDFNKSKIKDVNFKFIISDNGNQEFNKKLINKNNVSIIDNSKFQSSREHTLAIYKLELINVFIIHDDDTFNLSNLKTAIEFINESDCDVLVSPKLELGTIKEFKIENEVFEFYFLTPNRNCPLISGLYLRKMSIMRPFTDHKHLIAGKYVDVQIITELLVKNHKSLVFNKPFINYNEHDSNDNIVRNLNDRISLSNYISNFRSMNNIILSKIIFFGYPAVRFKFIHGILLSFLRPKILLYISLKLIKKLIKK